jgi:hypothetical protein
MKNILCFDIVNIHCEQPRAFSVKFDQQIIVTKKIINQQETIQVEFDNQPGQHLLELILIDTPNSQAKIIVGNFKLNQYECVDSRVQSFFQGPTRFDGSLQGLVKFELTIETPILPWQQKTRIY